ncbi:GNAT family N-acetyltransferase [Subtercola sp. Z020]|uniref:GNAT family N-acetyltransferase n=1 Tax=Subtercola sp. Z020 TaxID=2080582 RepID=UPI000CE9105E|nr:GNAT family N-acetyltransferase [Subtercola sp. Z020]PPF77928.1 GNAT family N-acetyltransferase [Subtercola sp. Z020]
MTVRTRDIRPDDLPALLALNNAAVPAVNALDAEALAAIVAQSRVAIVVEADADDAADPLGFVLALAPGADYDSENYRWFQARSADFLYVDRIVIGAGWRSRGLGPVLYEVVLQVARADARAEVFCEVNLEPPNPGSLAFHRRLGFEEVGRQSTKGGSVVVSLLALSV